MIDEFKNLIIQYMLRNMTFIVVRQTYKVLNLENYP